MPDVVDAVLSRRDGVEVWAKLSRRDEKEDERGLVAIGNVMPESTSFFDVFAFE